MPLFDPQNERERQREAQIQERNRLILERRLIPKLLKEFNRVAKLAGQGKDLDSLIPLHQENIEALLAETYKIAITGTSRRAIQEAPKSLFIGIEKKDLDGDVTRLIEEWLTTNALDKSKFVANTTREAIVSTIKKYEGRGTDFVAREIRKRVGGVIGMARSKTISRTETHGATQSANESIVKSLPNPPKVKEWVAIRDIRTRDDHAEIDGTAIPLDDDFSLGGGMSRPGDPSGGAEQVINCRCVLVYRNKI